MSALFEALQYDFMQHALLASLLASVLCAVTGTFIVVKRLVFLSGGVSHSAFAGLGMAYFAGFNPVLGAIFAAVLVSLSLTRMILQHRQQPDAMIGLLWAAGMAIGVLFVYLKPGYTPDLMPYLFGNILSISTAQLAGMLLFTAVTLVLTRVMFRQLVAVSFDDEFARLRGLPVGVLLSLLMVLNSIAIVILIQAVGIILVMALMTIPPLIGLALANDIRAVMWRAFVSALVIINGGLILSFQLDLPSGPVIVLLGILLLALVRMYCKHCRR